MLLWLALVPWPVRWLVLWRVLRSGLWRVLLWLVLWLLLLWLVLWLLLWLLLWQLQADTRRPKADCAYAYCRRNAAAGVLEEGGVNDLVAVSLLLSLGGLLLSLIHI